MAAPETDETATQERVFAFLTDPDAHPGVQRIDTHAASVFLEGARALKIKRAVRFPFLDYSTLEKRKAACEQEIRINRPLAPQIYRRVVPIVQGQDGRLSIGGTGTSVEYAVEMSRFDESRTLDHLAKSGPLGDALSVALADAISAAHALAPRADPELWIQSIPGLIEGVTKGLRTGRYFPENEIDEIGLELGAAARRLQSLLQERGRAGFIRRCHGDLHLGNIVMIDQQPVLFDAIEFDEKIASVDVFYDLAFALMDLLQHKQAQAANIVINRYLAATASDNIDALACLPLFMSLRAGIRARVLLARLERLNADITSAAGDVQTYFSLAQTLLRSPAPRLIAIGGLSGTGKSVLARALAPLVGPPPGAIILRSDVVRKELFQVKETERLPPNAYQPDVTRKVYATLIDRARRVLAHQHSAVIDAVLAHEIERGAVAAMAQELNVPLTGFFLHADMATRQRRIGSRMPDASDATAEIAVLQERYEIGAVEWTVIDASGTPEQTLDQCRAAGERR